MGLKELIHIELMNGWVLELLLLLTLAMQGLES